MFAAELARNAAAIRYDGLPAEVISAAKMAFEDSIGVAVAGTQTKMHAALRNTFRGDGQAAATIWGGGARTDSATAAFLNATAAHALDYDDSSVLIGGHPSAALVPPILAVCEELNLSGLRAIEAYITGFETQSALARRVMPEHYEIGWHPTATLGVFGAAAACGRLLDLDDRQLGTALCAAVSLAGGTKAAFGTFMKPVQVGRAARDGVLAAFLARSGCDANASIFEHSKGFFHLFNNGVDHPRHVQEPRERRTWHILDPGISYKQHPCCGSAHSAIDAALTIRDRLGSLDPSITQKIVVRMHPRRLAHTNNPDPQTGTAAKFSVQFLVAKAIVDGRIGLADFDEPFGSDPHRSTMRLIEIVPTEFENEFLAEVRLQTADDQWFVAKAETKLGRGPERPFSKDERREKFIDCTSTLTAKPDKLLDLIRSLDGQDRIEALSAYLA